MHKQYVSLHTCISSFNLKTCVEQTIKQITLSDDKSGIIFFHFWLMKINTAASH